MPTSDETMRRLREKYPQYDQIDDVGLATRVIEKYPQYEEALGPIARGEQPAKPAEPGEPNRSSQPPMEVAGFWGQLRDRAREAASQPVATVKLQATTGIDYMTGAIPEQVAPEQHQAQKERQAVLQERFTEGITRMAKADPSVIRDLDSDHIDWGQRFVLWETRRRVPNFNDLTPDQQIAQADITAAHFGVPTSEQRDQMAAGSAQAATAAEVGPAGQVANAVLQTAGSLTLGLLADVGDLMANSPAADQLMAASELSGIGPGWQGGDIDSLRAATDDALRNLYPLNPEYAKGLRGLALTNLPQGGTSMAMFMLSGAAGSQSATLQRLAGSKHAAAGWSASAVGTALGMDEGYVQTLQMEDPSILQATLLIGGNGLLGASEGVPVSSLFRIANRKTDGGFSRSFSRRVRDRGFHIGKSAMAETFEEAAQEYGQGFYGSLISEWADENGEFWRGVQTGAQEGGKGAVVGGFLGGVLGGAAGFRSPTGADVAEHKAGVDRARDMERQSRERLRSVLMTPEGAAAWAGKHPDEAAALGRIEEPTREDFRKAGLGAAGLAKADRAAFAQALRVTEDTPPAKEPSDAEDGQQAGAEAGGPAAEAEAETEQLADEAAGVQREGEVAEQPITVDEALIEAEFPAAGDADVTVRDSVAKAADGEIYRVQVKGRGEMFAVRDGESDPRGLGDTLWPTPAEAQQESATMLQRREQDRFVLWETRRRVPNFNDLTPDQQIAQADITAAHFGVPTSEQRDQAEADKAKADAAAKAEREDLGGFLDDATEIQRKRAVKVLDKKLRLFDGRVLTRKEIVRERVGQGARVTQRNGKHRLEWTEDGSDLISEVTKTEADYATHLIAQREAAAEAELPADPEVDALFGEGDAPTDDATPAPAAEPDLADMSEDDMAALMEGVRDEIEGVEPATSPAPAAGGGQAGDSAPAEPTSQPTPAPSPEPTATDAARKKRDDAMNDLVNLVNRKLSANAPLDPELWSGVVRYIASEVTLGVHNFADIVRNLSGRIPGPQMRELGPYVERAWDKLRERDRRGVLSATGRVADLLADEADVASDSEISVAGLAEGFARLFADGQRFDTITQARREAARIMGRVPTETEYKTVEEAIELGVVMQARAIIARNLGRSETYDALVDLYDRQPNLSTRTSTSMRDQAYSTPAPLAYIASQAADIAGGASVLESSAGNGMLLLEADPANAVANELNPSRVTNLRHLGFQASQGDGATLKPSRPVDRLIVNPPFGRVHDETGKARKFKFPGLQTTNIDHAIAAQGLAQLPDNGEATLILGSKVPRSGESRASLYNQGQNSVFYQWLWRNYNVVDAFTVSGSLYRKQGAAFPVDVFVIHGRGPSSLPLPQAKPPAEYETWEGLKEKLDEHTLLRAGAGPETDSGGAGEPGTAPPADDDAGLSGSAGGPAGRPGGSLGGGGTTTSARRPRDNADAGAAPRDDAGGDGEGTTADRVGPVSDPKPDTVAGDRRPAAGRSDAGGMAQRDPGRRASGVETEFQVSYTPGATTIDSVGTLVPRAMQQSIQEALDTIVEETGQSIEGFVASELNFTLEHLGKVFSAEQVDALAMAIANVKAGAGFVIGDQTGVGKGRFVAGMLHYAEQRGMIPVFITKDEGLYADIIRDMTAIGLNTPEKPYNLLVTQDLRGEKRIDTREIDGRMIESPAAGKKLAAAFRQAVANFHRGDGLTLTTGTGKRKQGKRYNAIATAYSQFQPINKTTEPWRNPIFREIAPHAMFVMDESHEAGGDGNLTPASGDAPTRAQFARELVGTAGAVVYSSATYAKRPDTMSLYAATDMQLAVADPAALAATIKRGGVAMQQVVANMLAQAKQYIRRERSFHGVTFQPQTVATDHDQANQVSQVFEFIDRFDRLKQAALTDFTDAVQAGGVSVQADLAVGNAGVDSTNFNAIMHNVVDQYLLAVKVKESLPAIQAALDNGEKPVIAVANTMESLLKGYMADEGLSFGDLADVSFADILRRYLDRSRDVLIKFPGGDGKQVTESYRLTDEQLGPAAMQQFNATADLIDSIDFSGLPASPIDWLKQQIGQMQVNGKPARTGEITGRSTTIDYSGDTPAFGHRPADEISKAGKRQTILAFQRGDLDAIILNQAGSTGISLHADGFQAKDLRQRHMVILQPEKNIDTFMQVLGRVHRTGQVKLPIYTLMLSDLPMETRGASVLMKKLASLNANVTADSKGSVSFEGVPELMNIVGDQAAHDLIGSDPEIADRLGLRLADLAAVAPENAGESVAKVTGRAALLPITDQAHLWDALGAAFETRMGEFKSRGENPLAAESVDLKAITLSTLEIVSADSDKPSPFTQPANLEQVSVRVMQRPYSGEQVLEQLAATLGEETVDSLEAAQAAGRTWAARQAETLAAAVDKAVGQVEAKFAKPEHQVMREHRAGQIRGAAKTLATAMTRDLVPGRVVDVHAPGVDGQPVRTSGIVTRLVQHGSGTNPAALSTWRVTVVVPESYRQLQVPLSQIYGPNTPIVIMPSQERLTLRDFDTAQPTSRQRRYIATGNLLAASEQLDNEGQVVQFTTNDGDVRDGILMPEGFDPKGFIDRRPIYFSSPANMLTFMGHGHPVGSSDGELSIRPTGSGFVFVAPSSRRKGAKYTLSKAATDAAGAEYQRTGNSRTMTMRVPASRVEATLQAYMEAGILFSPGAASEVRDTASLIEGHQTSQEMADQLEQRITAAEEAAAAADARPEEGPGMRSGIAPPQLGRRPERDDTLPAEADEAVQPSHPDVAPATVAPTQETEDRIGASFGLKPDTLRDRIAGWVADAVPKMLHPQRFLPKSVARWAFANNFFRLLKNVPQAAQDEAVRRVAAIVDPMGPRQLRLFGRFLLMENMLASIDRNEPRRFGFESREQAQAYRDRLHGLIQKTPAVAKALEIRRRVARELVEELVRYNALPAEALDRTDTYFHQMVLEHYRARTGERGPWQKRSFQKKRVEGVGELDAAGDYNSDYIEAEVHWMTEAISKLNHERPFRLLMERYDTRAQLVERAKAMNFEKLVGGPEVVERIHKLRDFMAETRGDHGLREQRSAASEELGKIDPTYTYRRKKAIQLARLERLHAEGELDLGPYGTEMLDRRGDLDLDSPRLFKFMAWLADTQPDGPGGLAARAFFKAVADQQKMIETALGEDFETWKTMLRGQDDIVAWAPPEGNIFYPAYTIPEHIAKQIMENELEASELTPEQIKVVRVMAGPRREFAIPAALAAQLDELAPPRRQPNWKDSTASLVEGTLRLWKLRVLLFPDRAVGYMVRNATGDSDPVIGSAPGIAAYLPGVTKELYRYHRGNLSLSPLLRKARDLAVVNSSMTAIEFSDIKGMRAFERFYQDKKPLSAYPKAFAKNYMRFVGGANEFRENLYRYAAFLYYRDKLNAGTLTNYGGSRKAVIDALTREAGVDVAAAQMARELIGDYGDLSVFSEWLRRFAIPFWSWNAVQFRRTPRLIANAVQAGDIKGAAKQGTVALTRAAIGAAVATGRLGVLYGMFALWNWTFFPDEERELGEYDRNSPHIILGRNPDGTIRIFRNVGAVGDYLEWFGVNDAIHLIPQWRNDQVTGADVLREMGKAPLNKLFQGVRPDVKAAIEGLSGQSYFPDVLNPRTVDRGEALSNAVALRDEHRMARGLLTGDGTRARPGYWWRKTGIGVVDGRRNALYQMYDLREKFLRQKGVDDRPPGTISPTRVMREAAMADDYQAFLQAREVYMDGGRDFDNFTRSLQYLDPIDQRLNDDIEQEFVETFLDGVQRQRLDQARRYAKDLEGTLWHWWITAEENGDRPDAEVAAFRKQVRDHMGRAAHRLAQAVPIRLTDKQREDGETLDAVRGGQQRDFADAIQWMQARGYDREAMAEAYWGYLRERYATEDTRRQYYRRFLHRMRQADE